MEHNYNCDVRCFGYRALQLSKDIPEFEGK